MEKKPVVSRKNLPHPPPFLSIVVGWLALDHWGAPGWLYGVLATLGGIVLLSWAIARFHVEVEVDLWGDPKPENNGAGTSKWRQRIDELKEKTRT